MISQKQLLQLFGYVCFVLKPVLRIIFVHMDSYFKFHHQPKIFIKNKILNLITFFSEIYFLYFENGITYCLKSDF